MKHLDRYGLELSTCSDRAAERYVEGVDLMLSLWPTAQQVLDSAVEADPDFALAVAARARLHAIHAQVSQAKAKIDAAQTMVTKRGTERERSHVQILALAIHGNSSAALKGALQHADRWPRDVVILSLMLGAFGLFAFSGMADHDQARVDLCERHAAQFEPDDWWFLCYRGWSHAENGNVKAGMEMTQRSLELHRRNANAAHAYTHSLYELGAAKEADMLISTWLPEYPREGILHGHIAWHGALLALEAGNPDSAMQVYHRHIVPSSNQGTPINIVSDTSSLLWRMKAYGYPVDESHWQHAADYASNYFQRAGFPFADVHIAMILAATSRADDLLSRIQDLEVLLQSGALPAGPMVPAVCHGLLCFAEQDYAGSARILDRVLADVVRLGGSGAQREIIEDTLIAAWMKSGELDKAKSRIEMRLKKRPSHRDQQWLASVAQKKGP